MMQMILHAHPATIAVAYALAFLWAILSTEALKTASTRRSKALMALSSNCAFWSMGVLFFVLLRMM